MTHIKQMNTSILTILAALLALIAPDVLAAGAGGGGLPYEAGLTLLQNSLTGPVALAVSVIAVVVTGATLIFGGDISGFARSMVYIVLVGAVLVAAGNVATTLFGAGASVSAGV